MKPALAMATENNALEDLGRATLQIVHDLKNQLNGLKLYATFLRKRLEREERPEDERETLRKLIAGIDRAAGEMTALVRYARPLELHQQTGIDLRTVIAAAVKDISVRENPNVSISCEIEDGPFYGEFDPSALMQAFKSLSDEAVHSVPTRDTADISLHVQRASTDAVIEWRGVRLTGRNHSFRSSESHGTIHTAQAARVIEAHGGRFECDANLIRATLPLSN
jgi:nitrogen fixation/metabolism regulation signal transduction histidine kinase